MWLQYVFLPEFTASKCPLIVPLLNQLSGIVPKDGYYNSSTVTIGRDFHYKPQYLPLLFYSHLKLQIEWQCDVHCRSRRQVLFVNKFVQNVQNNSFCWFYGILPTNKREDLQASLCQTTGIYKSEWMGHGVQWSFACISNNFYE